MGKTKVLLKYNHIDTTCPESLGIENIGKHIEPKRNVVCNFRQCTEKWLVIFRKIFVIWQMF